MAKDYKTIRFVNREGVELFKIPDGANIKITYPPGDGRGTIIRPCKYEGPHHVTIGSALYHIDEFAMRMYQVGARYEPEVQLQWAEILPITPGEEKYCTYNREKGNTCIGHLAGDFGHHGDRFFSSWSDRESGKNTPKFQTDFHSAVYALRRHLLKDYGTMKEFCEKHPEAKLPDTGNLTHYGFKLDAGRRQYFIRCNVETVPRDSRFIIYAYNKMAREREQAQPEKPSVLKQIRDAEKAPKPPRKPKAPGKKKDGAEL